MFSLLDQAKLRDTETQAAVDEADIRNMELQLQKRLFEQVCDTMIHQSVEAVNLEGICCQP